VTSDARDRPEWVDLGQTDPIAGHGAPKWRYRPDPAIGPDTSTFRFRTLGPASSRLIPMDVVYDLRKDAENIKHM
jgi:hypothetical protein